MEYPLTIKDLSSQQAILQDNDNNLIYLPKDKLPEKLAIGQILNLQINFESDNHRKFLAKEILNDILGNKN